MSAGGTLPVIDRHVRMREDALVRDKSYQQWPIGKQAARWLEALRWEDIAPNSRDAYEIAVARFAEEFQTFTGLAEFAPEDEEQQADVLGLLRWFLDKHWGNAAPATRRLRQAGLKSLFRWAAEEGLIGYNPMLKIKPPKRRKSGRNAHARETLVRLVLSQDSLRDKCAVQLLARLGLRKNELRLLKIRDIRLDTGVLLVQHGKGGRTRAIPLALESLSRDLWFHIQTDHRRPDEYLIYPKTDRARPMDHSSVHRWFRRCLNKAGLAGFPLHELRHSAAQELYSLTGNLLLATMLLGHESVATTEIYLHPTSEDLAAGLRQVEAAWSEQLVEYRVFHESRS